MILVSNCSPPEIKLSIWADVAGVPKKPDRLPGRGMGFRPSAQGCVLSSIREEVVTISTQVATWLPAYEGSNTVCRQRRLVWGSYIACTRCRGLDVGPAGETHTPDFLRPARPGAGRGGMASGAVMQLGWAVLIVVEQDAGAPAGIPSPSQLSEAARAEVVPCKVDVDNGCRRGGHSDLGAPGEQGPGRAEEQSVRVGRPNFQRALQLAQAADRDGGSGVCCGAGAGGRPETPERSLGLRNGAERLGLGARADVATSVAIDTELHTAASRHAKRGQCQQDLEHVDVPRNGAYIRLGGWS